MISSNNYVPFLKWRQSEYQALFKLEEEIKDLIVPYIILPPIEYDFADRRIKKTIQGHIEPMPNRLKNKWGSRLAILDFHEDLEEETMDNGESVIEYVHNEALALGCKLIPVISFQKSNWYLLEVKKIASTQNSGVVLRIFLEDLDRPAINEEIITMLRTFDLDITNTDLIIDLRTPDRFEPYILFSNIISDKIKNLNNIMTYRSFVIAANSLNLKEVQEPGGVFTRHEWMLYPHLINNFKDKLPSFGDYTTDNIEFLPQIDMRKINPAPKLIYTLPQSWHVLKGKEFRGNQSQMVALCSSIVNLPGYKGSSFSDGDERIYDTANKQKNYGSLGTWKQAAINHHMTKVVRQLSNYHASII